MDKKSEEDMLLSADREAMVETQIEMRGITAGWILDAMRAVPRHKFVPEDHRKSAHQDGPLEIGEGQTISQPYVIALMLQALDPGPSWKVLEVGSGTGYVLALLSRICSAVYGIERIESLSSRSRSVLSGLGVANVEVKTGDGTQGWNEKAPFQGIIVSAAAATVPEALLAQLQPSGRLVIPVGTARVQRLFRYSKDAAGTVTTTDLGAVQFVPLVGG